MQTIDAVKIRILRLCEQRNMSINRLATVCALPPSSIKNILYGKSCNPKTVDDKNDMRRAGYDACGVFLLAGV